MNTILQVSKKDYFSPCCHVKSLYLDANYLVSNTEPIDDDGQEHGWD